MSKKLQNGVNMPNAQNAPLLNSMNGQNIQLHGPALAISLFPQIQNGMNTNQLNYQNQLNMNAIQLLQQQASFRENNLFQIQNLAHQIVQAQQQQMPKISSLRDESSSSNCGMNSGFFSTPSASSLSTNDSGIMLPHATNSWMQLQTAAMKGLTIASQICTEHSRRPYFKKIDVLCDRLMQDLRSNDKAVVNINTHGIAWAIKDLIFVFNRIIGAWFISRDYFYSKSKDMECVRDEFDPDLEKNFLAWQEATIKFSQSLTNSFQKLHIRNQRNGNRKMNSSGSSVSTSGKMSEPEPFQKFFDPPVVDEEVQLSGNYLRSAIYKPVSVSSQASSSCNSAREQQQFEPFKFMFGDMLDEFERDRKRLYERGNSASDSKQEWQVE